MAVVTNTRAEAEAARYRGRLTRQRLPGLSRPAGSTVGLLLAGLTMVAALMIPRWLPQDVAPVLANGSAIITESGAMYVLDDGIAYPAANLASARLSSDELTAVSEAELAGIPRGRMRGIAGAPNALPEPAKLLRGNWQLCTAGPSRMSIAFDQPPYLSPPAGAQTVLGDGTEHWLISDGTRFELSGPATNVIETIPELTALIKQSSTRYQVSQPTAVDPESVVCAQSEPTAPFARPTNSTMRLTSAAAKPSFETARGDVSLSMPPGSGVLAVRSEGGYWLIDSSGGRYAIDNDAALSRLGFSTEDVTEVPEPILQLLPEGPTLSVDAAREPME